MSGYQCFGGCGYEGLENPGMCAECLPRFPRVHEETIRADERARIVAWLRDYENGGAFLSVMTAAEAIARGEHLK